MIKKRILILATYPIKNPQHGGQKRAHAIYEAYRARFSNVRYSAVFYENFYSEYDKDDIPLGKQSRDQVARSPLIGDIICGEAIFDDPTVKQRMTTLLLNFKPDIIHIEQPFPYLGLRPLLAELKMHPKLVFGSQNIEAPMKREILEGVGMAEVEIAAAEKKIASLEKSLSSESDLVIACTTADLKVHKSMGAQHTVLAANGIAPLDTNESSLAHWEQVFSDAGVTKTVLFVGSAHPPNWAGFTSMVGKGLGFLGNDARMVVAGSISDYFQREIKEDALDIEDATFWLRAYATGRLAEKSLTALIGHCDVIILPITEGGGSNLKTAEAILANKKVVATSHALRSFEWFQDFPNVWVADTQKDFCASITEALAAPLRPRTAAQQTAAQRVQWEYALADMITAVEAL